mmetsp:Transcript_23573/g.38407  ORF Transcript_23573/g.38407 Transcript_23573/m.38407 type:complete len:325 (-) Transcript_23573:1947-2921(-)
MADGNNIFVYMGGNQVVPRGVTHAIIHPSVKIVPRRAFSYRRQLVSVIFHDDVEIIEDDAFSGCVSLRGIKLLGVREIREGAFDTCIALSDVEFGDMLETVGDHAFRDCFSLRSIKMPSVRSVQDFAFGYCRQLNDVEFGKELERIECCSFYNCPSLQRIAVPLKDNLFPLSANEHRYHQFDECDNLTRVDIVGIEGIHNTISSLLLESWRDEMNEEIYHINRELPNTQTNEKTNAIRLWIRSVIDRMEHYKAEHNRLLKEHMVQLELAIWKVKLDQKGDNKSTLQVHSTERVKIDEGNAREEKRIMSGADIIIKNVIPFLKMG